MSADTSPEGSAPGCHGRAPAVPDRSGAESFHLETLDNGWTVGRFDVLRDLPGLVHLVTTRHGLDPHAGPAAQAEQIAAIGPLGEIAFAKQVHGRHVLWPQAGGLAGPGDALAVGAGALAVMVQSADCPLILLADRQGRAVAAAHASWRGTVQQIAAETVDQLTRRRAVEPADLIACICPSAGPCCYEVQDDVRQAALAGIGPHAEAFFPRRDGKMYFDLWAANTDQLLRAGVPADSIHCAGLCTICCNDVFPSYRAEGLAAGRFVAVITQHPV